MRNPHLNSILAEVSMLHRRLSNLLEIRNATVWGEGSSAGGEQWRPAMDLIEEPRQYRLLIDLPDLSLDEVTLEMKNRFLVISGKKSFIDNVEPEAMLRFERPLGVFRRQVEIPGPVRFADLEATMNNGVLSIILPRE